MISPQDILNARILVVDDKEANITLLERMLRGAGYTAVTSTTLPEEVCELHLNAPYDLILLDLEMPGMDGFQVMENLKEIDAGPIPVLVITAQPGHKLRALKSGARDFVSKPFDLAEVLLRVHNMLEVRLMHLEMRTLYERVLAEQKVSERLLLSVLPPRIAQRPRTPPVADPGTFPDRITQGSAEVSVLFADIVAFTQFVEGASTEVLMGVLQDLSARFDGDADDRRFEEIRTLGNAYLESVALADPLADQTMRAAHLALDMTRALDALNAHSRYKLRLCIGLEATAAAGKKRRVKFEL